MDVLPFQNVRVLDAASLARGDMDERATGELRSLLRQLASCRMGQLLLRVAVDQRVVVRFETDRELDRVGGRAAGMYHAASRTMVIDRTMERDEQLTTLAHELQHFVDGVQGWRIGTVQSEVRAQQTEAQVIRQLGLRAWTWGLTSSRQLRHPEDIATDVRSHPLYAGTAEEPARIDGRVHPLLEAHEVMPPMLTVGRASSGSLRVDAVSSVASTSSVGMVSTGGVTQAATGALGAARPTGFDPEPVVAEDSRVGRFLGALDANRLATGA